MRSPFFFLLLPPPNPWALLPPFCHWDLCSSLPRVFLTRIFESTQKKRDLMGSFESRHAVEQGFQYLMKMIAVSIPEIPGQIKKSLAVLCSSSKSGPKEKRSFVLRCFLTNFICSGLATPEVTLNMRLTQETKDFCSLLSHLLQVASTGPPAVGKDANFINTLTQSSYVQKKIDFIWSHLTTEEEEEPGLMQCYIDFLKIWEIHHLPCQRQENRYTCWLHEPSPRTSLLEFANFLKRTYAEVCLKIVQTSRMGVQSLDLEVFNGLLEWIKGEVERGG